MMISIEDIRIQLAEAEGHEGEMLHDALLALAKVWELTEWGYAEATTDRDAGFRAALKYIHTEIFNDA